MNKQRGLTIPELMVALTIGLFVLGATYSVFTMSASSVNATGQQNQLQESARLSLRMLQDDIAQAGFFADLTGADLVTATVASPNLAGGSDCIGAGLNNSSYPAAVGHFRTLWAEHVKTDPTLTCITQVVKDSDVLQVKRLDGVPLLAADLADNEIYYAVNVNQGQFFQGSDGIPAGISNSRVYRYRHRSYYIRKNAGGIPSLYMHDLSAAGMATATPLVEGIEAIEYEFGVDINGDSVVDTYLATPDVTDAIWDQQGLSQIVSVRVHLLLTSVAPDKSLKTGAVTYDMPSGARSISNDGLRRKKVSTTVMLRNPIIVNRRDGI
ncbi:PilW family protein [uncultured Ferrimonas sp.]|uniref:PilW family protein n=1 Tax=uncultured Ferrimonas sp. TaxID=432640 RepID=UPI002612BF6E|nr:PilW family protein [uncultured Ferrimonas sp.]